MGEQVSVRVARYIPGWAKRAIASMISVTTPSNSSVKSRWIRHPDIPGGADVCIFVVYLRHRAVPAYSLYHARAWAASGFRVILVLNCDDFDTDVGEDGLEFASGVMLRQNRGYDFGAWATVLTQFPLHVSAMVVLANDSMFGPLDSFTQMIARARTVDADVIGLTESVENGRHIQSFVLFFREGALKNDGFWRFWRKVRAGGRIVAVYRYELTLLKTMEAAGLRCSALFKCQSRDNPTLTKWRELIDAGFPYLKVALIRLNPFGVDTSGWQEVLKRHGFDPALTGDALK